MTLEDNAAIIGYVTRIDMATAAIRVMVDCLPESAHDAMPDAIDGIAATIDEAARGIDAVMQRIVQRQTG